LELRNVHVCERPQTTEVEAIHPERRLSVTLGQESTALVWEAGAPFFRWLADEGFLKQGETVSDVWIDAEAKSVAFSVGGRKMTVDYGAAQFLLRELARVARKEAVARKPDPPGLSPDARWEYLYQHGGDGWELGKATPPLVRYFTAHPPTPPQTSRCLVVGCGRGHEALLLAQVGSTEVEVVGIDLAETAVRKARELAASKGLSSRLSFLQKDLFVWASQDTSQRGRYDLIVEHNCFCAIEPSRRDEYIQAVAGLLRPQGQLVGLFYTHDYPGGPPFGSTEDEICRRLAPSFCVTHKEIPHDSSIVRAGLELLLVAERR